MKTQCRERARARRDDLGARHADDVPRAAVVRARHDGLAREDEPRPRGRDPADGDPRDPERLRRPAARLADDDARRRLRARADPRVDPAPLCGGRPQLRPAARDRRAARLFHAAVLRVAADDPAGARRGGRDAHVAGEQLDRGRNRIRGARRARLLAGASSPSSARRTCCTSMRRPISSPSC